MCKHNINWGPICTYCKSVGKRNCGEKARCPECARNACDDMIEEYNAACMIFKELEDVLNGNN